MHDESLSANNSPLFAAESIIATHIMYDPTTTTTTSTHQVMLILRDVFSHSRHLVYDDVADDELWVGDGIIND